LFEPGCGLIEPAAHFGETLVGAGETVTQLGLEANNRLPLLHLGLAERVERASVGA
jgi:hypothetical protein